MRVSVVALLSAVVFLVISPWVSFGLFYIITPYIAWIIQVTGGGR